MLKSVSAILATLMFSATSFANFAETCRNTTVESNGTMLCSVCKDVNQVFWKSCIQLRGISNEDGVLTQGMTDVAASFGLSCSSVYVRGSVLRANCADRGGVVRTSRLELDRIENQNGSLVYSN